MRNPLKRLGQRGAPKLTMRERATLLKASAARVIRRRPAVHPTDQPSGETLLPNTVLDRGDDGFRGARHLSHERDEGAAEGTTRDDAGKNGASRSETDMGRHETFNTALPLVEGLFSGASSGKAPASPRDAILAHRAARQALNDVCDATDELAIRMAGGDTSDEAMAPARAEWERRNEAELDAWNELLNARPTDHAELIAQIRYIAASPALGDFQHPEVVLENIAQSAEHITALDTPTSSLAIACAWATDHLAWMAVAARGDDWDDDRVGRELDRYGMAFRRAVDEPSASLSDIRAKARMLLADLNENDGTSFADLSDDERLMRVLLREIIAFPSVANGGGAEGDPQTIENAASEVKAEKALPRLLPDADQSRRAMIAGSLAAMVPLSATAITGTILGTGPYHIGRDLSAVAEAWIADAADLGMFVLRGPDGNLWRGMAIDVTAERVAAQDAHWFKLNNRPPLLRAVFAVVEGRGVTHG